MTQMHENTSTTAQQIYPYNLLMAVKGRSRLTLPGTLTKDVLAGIQYALSTLDETEQMLLHLRYCQWLSPIDASAQLALSAEQADSLEKNALSKLRQPSKWGYILYGVAGYMKKKKRHEYNRGYTLGYKAGYETGATDTKNGATQCPPDDILNRPIECLNLSSRVLEALHRSYTRIGELAVLDNYDILKIRGLGKTSANEVARALNANGIRRTQWDAFLL